MLTPRLARESAPQSMTSRKDRVIHAIIRLTYAAGLGGHLENRDAGARWGGEPHGDVSPGRHGQSDAGQAKNQFINLLAGSQPSALAHRVANVAKHEEVSQRGACKAREVLRFACYEPAREAFDRTRCARSFRARESDLLGERGIDRHVLVTRESEKTLGEIGIVAGERSLDLALCYSRIQRSGDGVVSKRGRIILGGKQQLRLVRARREGDRGASQAHGEDNGHNDPRSEHALSLASRHPISSRTAVEARCK